MSMGKVRELAEAGYRSALENNEPNSKQFFWDILLVVNRVGEQREVILPEGRKYAKVENREDMLIVAYYLSKYGHENIFSGSKMSQSAVIKRIAQILNINPNTLKNQRDYFDTYTGSHRRGWMQELDPHQKDVFGRLKDMPQENVLAKVRAIIA